MKITSLLAFIYKDVFTGYYVKTIDFYNPDIEELLYLGILI